MSKEKKTKIEIPYTQTPEYKNQVTQKYMLDFVSNTQSPETQLWYCDLVDKSKKTVTRGEKTFETLDIETVRKAFIDKFFKEHFENRPTSKKPTYQDKVNELRKKAEEALKAKKK